MGKSHVGWIDWNATVLIILGTVLKEWWNSPVMPMINDNSPVIPTIKGVIEKKEEVLCYGVWHWANLEVTARVFEHHQNIPIFQGCYPKALSRSRGRLHIFHLWLRQINQWLPEKQYLLGRWTSILSSCILGSYYLALWQRLHGWLQAEKPLWDPWGLFFIHLTHESGISDYKGMNSGWMNLGWIFLYLFLSIKKDDIQCVFFHKIKNGNFITL